MAKDEERTIDIFRDTSFDWGKAREQLKGIMQKGKEAERMKAALRLTFVESVAGNVGRMGELMRLCEPFITKHGLPEEKGMLLYCKGRLASQRGDYEEGKLYCLRAIQILKQLDIPLTSLRAYVACGVMCRRLNLIEEAVEYMNKALEIARAMSWSSQVDLIMFNLCEIKGEVQSHEESIRDHEELIRFTKKTFDGKPNMTEAHTLASMAYLYYHAGDMDKLKKYGRAAIEMVRSLSEPNVLHADYLNLEALICGADGDEKGMLEKTAQSLAASKGILQASINSHQFRFDYYLRKGDHKKAKQHLDAMDKTLPADTADAIRGLVWDSYQRYYERTGDAKNELIYYKKLTEHQKKKQEQVLLHRIKHMNAMEELIRQEERNKDMEAALHAASKELNMATYHLQQRNQLLTELQANMQDLKKAKSKADVIFDSLSKKIEQAFGKEEEEKARFRERFDEANRGFIASLHQAYPTLTATECRVCALLRAGFNTKEISDMLSTAFRNIENHRVSIRKKMKLNRTDTLNLILAEIK